jgi:hypothetical protein
MRKGLIWFLIAAAVLIGALVYRSQSRSPNSLNVEPHAREVIEKAKQRR